VGNDESAYLLQARIFASGRLAGPPRPLPEFFQQYHVFVEPVLAAKYPPGHSLLLAPGIWIGLPGFVPALLVALTAAILYSVTRRLANGSAALLAVLLLTTSDIALRFDASYFSEVTTAALFAIAWWALLKYKTFGKQRWLVLWAIAVSWGAVTRPLTMLAFALPAAVAAISLVVRRRAWADLGPSLAAGLLIVAILPIWNARVAGDWRTLPQSEYARRYLPSDRLGFGASVLAPAAPLSPDEERANRVVAQLHAGYSAAGLPQAAAERAANIIRGTWSYGGTPGIAVLFAAVMLPIAITRIVIGTSLCVFGAYLAYAHDPSWTLYYLELQPALAFLTAIGFFGATQRLSRWVTRRRPGAAPWASDVHHLAFAASVIWLAAPTPGRIVSYRRAHVEQREYRAQFERAIAGLPSTPSIVFLSTAPGHGEQRLVENVPDLWSEQTWIVHDLGEQNVRLLALAPARRAYLCREYARGDTANFRIEPLQGATSSEGSDHRSLIQPIDP